MSADGDTKHAPARDPYLDLALDGVHAIEASAGTGKTFTLATLVVRLVVERGLRVGQVLAVTFTEAATQELRSRIRARLLLAEELVGATPAANASPEATLTHAVLDAHLARGTESADALRRRLHAAANDIDLAAIFTIHGFCARVLREHALEVGQAFDAPELLTSDTALYEAIAADLWRSHGSERDAADDLLALWPGGPQALAADLAPLVREPLLRPALAELPDDPAPRLHATGEALAAAFRAHGDDFRAALVSAVEGKILHGGSYKLDWIAALFDSLHHWCHAGERGAPFEHAKLPQLHRDTLQLRTSVKHTGRTPDSPICDAVPGYLDALTAVAEWKDARRVELLHRLRDDARLRVARAKQQQRVQTYDDLIDRVADAIDPAHDDGRQAEALTAKLRAQYAVALVDEFQDTDARQWRIFDHVFGAASGAPALYVIGDPKQAIYGFRGGDVETYLAARATAEAAPPLALNFRSRPSVLQAVSALYAQAQAAADADTTTDPSKKIPPPFIDGRIAFKQVEPGGVRTDADFQRHGTTAPALTLWRAPPPEADAKGKLKPHSAGRSRELATQACVAAIHRVLTDARDGHASIEGRPVQPGDIAVLVRSHNEATRIRHALAMAGIPAVAAGKQSLFATPEARDLHALLLALLHGADDGRLRMALSTVLVGLDATAIAALDDDGEALRDWQLKALAWRDRLQRGGPLALINDLCAEHAGRLLGLLDGERRLTNYLQLAELLQDAQARALGLHGLVDWLANAIADANANDESQLLRLESDARRVQVVTLHKSKGLEYPLVFMPFAAIGAPTRSPGQRAVVNGKAGRALHWKLLRSQSGWDAAEDAWRLAQRAEDARLLYVGLTRARHALWLASGMFSNHDKSPLLHMVATPDALAAALGSAVAIDASIPPAKLPWLAADSTDSVPPARIAARALASDWWVYSFTQLANAEGQGVASASATQPAPGGQDEPAADADAAPASGADPAADSDAFDPRFAGTRFGVVLHDVLEHTDFARWAAWTPGAPAPGADDAELIAKRLRAGGYPAEDIDDGINVLTPLIGHTLTVALPEGVRLADVPADRRRPEIEFQFALAPTRVDALLALLHRHGLLTARQGFGARRRLEGLMTGLIDLTYVHDGRWYVLDYKSNRLPGYGPAQLDEAMAHSEYDLQALIYTLALHRWLRFRLGDKYDYARDFGGARYVFCRGLDASRADAQGVQAWRFDPELVDELDALFAGHSVEVAA
ncbi:exodeoxyribonuclease V subunit beta [Luteimonas sp. MC1572]|uniref:UvrD-helicase domain-containing protein n=1 Tax=Luteimonas sp. MC1572 TaxID=2799325 RepID=UPI0018F09AED|nr:exodeoxyribonuclease V subunit beta [Luteimonas sp. MC1572]MBJ6981991.1 UvrD-helicase domain-containing protein [Luteimonas sp. MC1572]QQO03290.1 UvrD-helicase domain-containing protein [Luteimonas sp. MC1572]